MAPPFSCLRHALANGFFAVYHVTPPLVDRPKSYKERSSSFISAYRDGLERKHTTGSDMRDWRSECESVRRNVNDVSNQSKTAAAPSTMTAVES